MSHTRMRVPVFTAGFVLIALLGSAPAVRGQQADNQEKFIIEALPDQLSKRVESERKMLLQFGLGDPDKTPKGVINALKLWTHNYPAVRVCFFSSPQSVRSRIAKIAMEWTKAVPGVPLDFGDLANPRVCPSTEVRQSTEVNHIRVGYAQPGYWSLVGTDSIRLAGQNEQSINLEGFDSTPPNDSEFSATVLHEFGHAIGLKHEHQNPLSKCHEEFDWPKIYGWLTGPPNKWSREKVDFNMGVLNEQGLLATEFDNKSIMLYTFPPWYYKKGKSSTCYSEMNTGLSVGDIALVSELYPNDVAARIAVVNKIREHSLEQVNASGQVEGAKSGVVQFINELLPGGSDKVAPKE